MAINIESIPVKVRSETHLLCIGDSESATYTSIAAFTKIFTNLEYVKESDFKSFHDLLNHVNSRHFDII